MMMKKKNNNRRKMMNWALKQHSQLKSSKRSFQDSLSNPYSSLDQFRNNGCLSFPMILLSPNFTSLALLSHPFSYPHMKKFTSYQHLMTAGPSLILSHYGMFSMKQSKANTRKVFKLSHSPDSKYFNYFFGFDESKNEHKIFSINTNTKPITIEFMIFSLSSYSWRKIHVEEDELPPINVILAIEYSVCVNSVIHFMLGGQNKLLAFDLTIEKFSIINLPEGAHPHEAVTLYTRKGKRMVKYNYPFLMNVNGLLGVVCHDRVTETNEMHIWILQDYVNRVWVKETIMFSEPCFELDGLQPIDYRFMGNIVLSLRRLSTDMISATILDMNTRSFKLVNFTLSHQFLHSKTLSFHQVSSYVESLLPLRER